MNNTDLVFKHEPIYGGEFTIKNSTLVVSRKWRDGALTDVIKFSDIDPDYHIEKQFTLPSFLVIIFFLTPAFISLFAWIVFEKYFILIISVILCIFALLVFLNGFFTGGREFLTETIIFTDKNKVPIFEIYRPAKANKTLSAEYDTFIKILVEKIGGKPKERSEDINQKSSEKISKRSWTYP